MKRKIPKGEVLRSLKKKGYGGDVSSVILEHTAGSKIKKKRKCNCKKLFQRTRYNKRPWRQGQVEGMGLNPKMQDSISSRDRGLNFIYKHEKQWQNWFFMRRKFR